MQKWLLCAFWLTAPLCLLSNSGALYISSSLSVSAAAWCFILFTMYLGGLSGWSTSHGLYVNSNAETVCTLVAVNKITATNNAIKTFLFCLCCICNLFYLQQELYLL